MAANDRNNPIRGKSSWSDYSLIEFLRDYPDDAACLDRLWRERYAPDGHHAHCPKCDRERKFHRTTTRASYTCDTCGLHVHPMKGTIFEKSTTSLQLWFYAMYLMTSTRCGISAKQLERELGVGYKTAHRMMKRIRTELMTDEDDEPLTGDVEVDETGIVGQPRLKQTKSEAARRREAGRPSSAWSSAVGVCALAWCRRDAARGLVEPSQRTSTRPRSSTPTTGLRTSRCATTSKTTASSTIPPAHTSKERRTRTRSKGSSGISRPGCEARTSTSRRSTCSPT